MPGSTDSYRQTVAAHLKSLDFVELRGAATKAGAFAAFRRRRFHGALDFGFSETFVFLFGEHAGPDRSAEALRVALAYRVPFPRGLGTSVVVYPVFPVQQAGREHLALIGGPPPKHWAAFEFPVVAELASSRLLRPEKPFFGARNFRRMRREADELFVPRSPP